MLHADLDSFYASVEQRDDPRLRGRPVAVGGGIIMAASYEAKAYGVSTPMGERIARQLCPDLLVVPMRPKVYMEASRAVFEIFHDLTPNVEGISVDEAFLDVGGLARLVGSPSQVAAAAGAGRGGVADLGRGSSHEVPRKDRERGQQARRLAGRSTRRRGGFPVPAPDRTAVGSR